MGPDSLQSVGHLLEMILQNSLFSEMVLFWTQPLSEPGHLTGGWHDLFCWNNVFFPFSFPVIGDLQAVVERGVAQEFLVWGLFFSGSPEGSEVWGQSGQGHQSGILAVKLPDGVQALRFSDALVLRLPLFGWGGASF